MAARFRDSALALCSLPDLDQALPNRRGLALLAFEKIANKLRELRYQISPKITSLFGWESCRKPL